MKKILINVIHPNLNEQSKVNKKLVDYAKKESNVTINDLYKNYKNFNIDIKKEQNLLLENDVIIFQFPFQWLSSPALLKEWFDVVLAYDFAYGQNAKLSGKIFAICLTAGSPIENYGPNGSNKFTVNELLKPFEATANYIKMNYKNPFIVYGTFGLSSEDLESKAKEYIAYIKNL